MKSDLRKNPHRSIGRYWLTMSDASAFTLVRSSVSIAEALRTTLSVKEKILVKQSAAELAVLLLTAAEAGWGKGKASHLITQMIELKKIGNAQKGRIFLSVRDAMAQLPLILWPQEKLLTRRELLEELTRLANHLQDDAPSLPTRDEIREREWRESIMALRKSETRQRG
jgi:hypothetical protein